MELKFYYCKYCGKIIAIVWDGGTPTICCGEAMSELIPSQSDGSLEKHVPVIKVKGNHVLVTVGTAEHPMVAEHYIEWILLQTDMGIQKKWLKPGDIPKADFMMVAGEKVQAAYEYCNVHKLWKAG